MTLSFFDTVSEDISGIVKNSRAPRQGPATEWSSPETIAMFGTAALHGGLQNCVAFVKNFPGFDSFRKMCDLGGNYGFYSMGILDVNESLEAVVQT